MSRTDGKRPDVLTLILWTRTIDFMLFRICMFFCLYIFMLINVDFTLVVLYRLTTKDTWHVLFYYHCFYTAFTACFFNPLVPELIC